MTATSCPSRYDRRFSSPLRYPGGKGVLCDFVREILRASHLSDGHYAEPYAGGASLALRLLFDECVSHVHLNDIDGGVYAFWHSVLHDTEALCRLIRSTPVTTQEWERQRATYFSGRSVSTLERGFATFFLNRTNRSGIIASGGMIGGRAQSGPWKLDARFNPVDLEERVLRIAQYRDRIHISNLDAVAFLRGTVAAMPTKSLAYLDPPYLVKGKRGLYANFYSDKDHAAIASLLPSLSIPWIVSYDDQPWIRELYADYRSLTYFLHYSAGERHHGAEVMFFSERLTVPGAAGPCIAPLRDSCRLSAGEDRGRAQ